MRSIIIVCLILVGTNKIFAQTENFPAEMRVESDSICLKTLFLKYNKEIGKFGYVDQNDIYVIQPAYYCATEFIDCLALTSKNKNCSRVDSKKNINWTYINKKNNKYTIPPNSENRYKWENKIITPPNRG